MLIFLGLAGVCVNLFVFFQAILNLLCHLVVLHILYFVWLISNSFSSHLVHVHEVCHF